MSGVFIPNSELQTVFTLSFLDSSHVFLGLHTNINNDRYDLRGGFSLMSKIP